MNGVAWGGKIMRFKVSLGMKKEKESIVEAPWPTGRGERYLVHTRSSTNPDCPRTMIGVHRALGVVVMQDELLPAQSPKNSAEKSQDSSPPLRLERMVRLRHLAVHWNPEEGMQQVMAEVVTHRSGILYAGLGYDLPAQAQNNGTHDKAKKLSVRAQMTGKVLQVLVAPGTEVSAETPLLVIEAMKMENRVFPARGGKVLSVSVKVGDLVQFGKELLTIE
jgi:biotin carboxyl carrier protein